MAFPDLLHAEDYDAIRALLGVTEADVTNETIDQLPYGPQAEAFVQERVTTWATDKVDAAKGLLLRMAASYAAAAYLAETFVQGGVLGLVRYAGQGQRDWSKLAATLWQRALDTTAGMLETADPDSQMFDLSGTAISGPSRTYYKPRVGSDWWKYPPVVAYSGAPFAPLPEEE